MLLTRLILSSVFSLSFFVPRRRQLQTSSSTQLANIPGLTIVGEHTAPPGFRFFVLSYEQPVNHLFPWKGGFAQRLTLLHRSLASPMIVNASGR